MPPGALPAGGTERPADPSLLGLRLPASGPARRPTRTDDEWAEEFRSGAGRGRAAAAAGGRAGGLLPERRTRLVRRARPGGPPRLDADPGVHAGLRSGGVRRGRRSPARWPRWRTRSSVPIPTRQADLADTSPIADLALRDALPQRARGGEVRPEPRRARCGLQGGAHRRRLGRDPRRLPALPSRHAAVRQRRPGSGRRPARCWISWSRATRCRADCCCRTASARRSTASGGSLGFAPTLDGGGGRPDAQDAGPVVRRFPERSSAIGGLPRAARAASMCRGQLLGRAPGEPGAVSLGQDHAARTTS